MKPTVMSEPRKNKLSTATTNYSIRKFTGYLLSSVSRESFNEDEDGHGYDGCGDDENTGFPPRQAAYWANGVGGGPFTEFPSASNTPLLQGRKSLVLGLPVDLASQMCALR
jgi:hypothetical protein